MAEALTGPDGHATFPNSLLGKHRVEVIAAPGLRLPPAQEVMLAQDGQTVAVTFQLDPQATL